MGQQDRMHTVAQPELLEDVCDVSLDRALLDEELCPISALDWPCAISRNTSSSRPLSSSSFFGAVGRGRRVNSLITRLVIVGESSASPAATVRIAASSCSGGSSLRTKPLAPARSAS